MVGILKRRRSFCVFLPLCLLNSLSLSTSVSLSSLMTFIMLPHSLIIISLGWIRFHNRTNSIEKFSSPNLFTTARGGGRFMECGRGLTAKAEIFPMPVSVFMCVWVNERVARVHFSRPVAKSKSTSKSKSSNFLPALDMWRRQLERQLERQWERE